MSQTTPTYWDYLQLDRLLELQGGLEGDEDALLTDELHFIIVHQVYELWFKLVIRSLRLARNRLDVQRVDEETIPYVAHHLGRVNSILRLGVNQWDVVETLTPQDFLAFRDKLMPASGFQSFQMREFEILMGLEDAERIHYGNIDPVEHIAAMDQDTPAGRLARSRVEKARNERTLLAVVNDWLYRTPIEGSRPGDPDDDRVVNDFVEAYLARLDQSHERNLVRLTERLSVKDPSFMAKRFELLRSQAREFLHAESVPPEHREKLRRTRAAALFIESYRNLPLLSWPRLLLDVLVEMEQQVVLWRHRHARMVERTIGRRVGTGGSEGVDYLDQTGRYRVFRDLWAVRTLLLRREELPELANAEFYGFTAD